MPNFKGNIDIEILENKDYIVCRLTDNGPGITDAKKAMTPYFTTKKGNRIRIAYSYQNN